MDGTLWMFGGEGRPNPYAYGIVNDIWRFDPLKLEWTWIPGSTQYYYGAEYTVENRSSDYGLLDEWGANYRPGSRKGAIAWSDNAGNVWIFGGAGYAPGTYFGDLQDLWYLDL